jgi:hypothetical protein
MENFLPLSREIQKHWIYKDNDCFKVWIDILLNARYSKEPKTDIYKGTLYTINYAEFLYSRPTYSQRLNIPEAKLRTLIENMVKDNMIEKVNSLGKNKATVYRVNNYEKYNFSPSETVDIKGVESNIHQVITKSTPSDNQVITTKEDRYIEKKEKKNIYAEFVSMTETEYTKLVDEYGEINTRKMITTLDNYKGSNNKKYASDYRAILNWVVDKVVVSKKVVNGESMYQDLTGKYD